MEIKERKPIYHANLKVTFGNKIYLLPNVVYKETDGYYRRLRVLEKYKLPREVKVVSFDVIKIIGYAEN